MNAARRAVPLLALLAALVPGARPASAQPAPFSHFSALDSAGVAKLQVQLTYLGGARRRLPTLSFTTTGVPPDSGLLARFRRPRFAYGVNSSGHLACAIPAADLRALLDSLGTLPDVTAGDVDSVALYSLQLVDTSSAALRGFEAILNAESARETIQRLFLALGRHPRATTALARIGCALGGGMGPRGDEVTRSTSVRLGRFAFDPAQRRMTCVAQVTNIGRDSLPGPITLLVEPRPDRLTLVEADGFGCGYASPGGAYVVVPLDAPLAPGASVERRLVIVNPRQEDVRFSHRVFAGTD